MTLAFRLLFAFCTAALLTFAAQTASAQAPTAFPSKPVRVVVSYATGGAFDSFARIVGQVLSERLGQPFLVDNRPGAGGTVAAAYAAKAPADGYTLFLADTGTHAIAPVLYANPGYDPIKDFVPVSLSVSTPLVLVASPSVATDLRDLIAQAKARPGSIAYASPGSGGISHLGMEMFKLMAGIDLLHVPYKGSGPAMADLLGGQVQVTLASISTALPHIRAGKVRAFGVTSALRVASLPDVPTFREAGLPDFAVETWLGVLAPAGTPRPIIDLLQREFTAVLKLPHVRAKLAAQNFEVIAGTGDGLTSAILVDKSRWASIVKQSGARIE